MSNSNLLLITGRLPAIQSQLQSMLAEKFACCSVPFSDTDSFNKIARLAQAIILIADEPSVSHLGTSIMAGKTPIVLVLNQPSPETIEQAYQFGVSKVILWPKSKEEIQIAIQQCIPKKSSLEGFKNWMNALLRPTLQFQKGRFLFAQKREDQALQTAFQINLLGELSIQQGPFQLRPHTHREQELLGYLFFNYPKPIKREKLCAALWPGIDPESARNRLNVLIHRMRKGLGGEQGIADWLTYDSRLNAYYLCIPESIQIDVHQYQSLLTELKTTQPQAEIGIQLCKKIVELYRGEFLEGIEHSEWIDRLRMDIREKLQGIILRLADYYLQRNLFSQAIYYCRRGVELDPCVEALQQRLMLALALNGDREAAIRAYRRFEQIRMEEFIIEPSSSSKSLYKLIEEGSFKKLSAWINHLAPIKLNQ